jgi:DNA polymerase-3 subunit epsilon
MANILFFDTETTGKPLKYTDSFKNVDNWPRIIQLAFALFDDSGNLIRKGCHLIKPDNWVIPNEKFWIENGFFQEKSEAEGIPIQYALNDFVQALNQCQVIVAHNISFDLPITQAEMYRLNMQAETRPEKVCTMKISTNICKIPNTNGFSGFKWPKLNELHNHLFQTEFDGAHDALNDVLATAKCYFEIKKQNLA